MKITTALFDLDGTLVDCEYLYTDFWNKVGWKYGYKNNLGLELKGVTVFNILDKYFPHIAESDKRNIISSLAELNDNMPLKPVNGAPEFVRELHKLGIKMAIVTSAPPSKAKRAVSEFGMEGCFGAIVGDSDVKIGKPNPDCYLMAAKKLDSFPEECAVFEDSIFGIEAGAAAKMRVIALTTTNSRERIESLGLAREIISDFRDSSEALKALA